MRSYPIRYRIWLGAALFHLVLVIVGESYGSYAALGPLAAPLTFYATASGAGYNYGFFAPGIDSQLRALFDLSDKDGHTRTVALEDGASHEAAVRMGDIIEQFAAEVEDTVELQHKLSASLGATILNRYPGSRGVTVRLEQYNLVSMAEYRSGKRPGWSPVYQATYEIKHGRGDE